MKELDFVKLKGKVTRLTRKIFEHKKAHTIRPEEPVDKYIENKVQAEFHKRYNEIYEELFRIDERLDKLENNK